MDVYMAGPKRKALEGVAHGIACGQGEAGAQWVSISIVRPQCCRARLNYGVKARGVPCGDWCRTSCYLR
jgi:hypothetical protein